jgi:hypothetical protein
MALNCATVADISKVVDLTPLGEKSKTVPTRMMYQGISSWLDVRALTMVPQPGIDSILITNVDDDAIWFEQRPEWCILGIKIIGKSVGIYTSRVLNTREKGKWEDVIRHIGFFPTDVHVSFIHNKKNHTINKGGN